MALFDALTGAAGHQAVANQQQTLGSIIPNLATTGQAGYAQAGDALKQGFAGARTDLGQGYDAAGNAIRTGATGALDFLNQGQQGALGQLGQARDTLTMGGGAYAPLSALADTYGKGANLYADALGINGAGGNQRAVDAFQRGPGYQAGLDTGLDAITRHANAAGGLGGNSLRDTVKFGTDYSNQDYGNYLNRLSAYNPLQLQATQGAAAGNQANNTTLAGLDVTGANLLNSGGQNRAQISQQQGGSLSELARSYFGGLAGQDTAQGGALAGNAIGGAQNWQNVFQNALPQYNDTFKQDAKASTDASTNSLNLGMNLAKLLASGAGSMGGLPMNFSGPSGGKDFAGLGGWA